MNGKRHWMLLIMYDNLGFRIKGARAGYDQYTMVICQMISPADLRRVGFYKPMNDPEPPISPRLEHCQVTGCKRRYRSR